MSEFSAELLREARTRTGLTAAELAERAGLHRVSVSTFERGLRPTAETWVRLQKALLVALDEAAREITKVRKKITA